ncbi:hypothetical protein [Streptomyces sp. NPDC048309]
MPSASARSAGRWTETGELTPSLKLRRTAIRERYGDVIEELHAP